MTAIPDTIEEITADWLSTVLAQSGVINCRIESVDVRPLGNVGTLSSMAQCRLRYDKPSGGEPGSVVVKLMPESPAVRKRLEELHGFEREIRFYRDVAAETAVRVPKFYFGDCANHRAVLVLEDLTDLAFRDQVRGLTNRETVAAARQIAPMHARFWNGRNAAPQWMPVDDFPIVESYADAWPDFEAVYGLRIGHEAVALGRRLGSAIERLLAAVAARPHTVCHGDYRADNLFFGDGGNPDAVVVIDWQLATCSIGALDVARLLGGSEPPKERAGRTLEALAAWHDALTESGVNDYPPQDALHDLRLGALLNLFRPIHVFSKWGANPGGRKGQFLDTIATRQFAFAVDIEAGRLLS